MRKIIVPVDLFNSLIENTIECLNCSLNAGKDDLAIEYRIELARCEEILEKSFADLRPKAASEHEQGDRLLGHQDPKTTRKHYERKPTKVKPIR